MQQRNVLQRLVPRRTLLRRAFARLPLRGWAIRLGAFAALLGPGLISAIAGDDAGGIATYAAVGAKYGYQLLWSLVIITVSLAVVQEMTARLTVVSGKGLSDLIREQFGVRIAALAMFALLVSNASVTISEFAGVAAATELFGISRYISVPLAALAVWYIVARGNYHRAERVFLVLAAVLGVYVFSAIEVKPDWSAVLRGTVIPSLQSDRDFILLTIAVIGTTISPYMQFALSATLLDKGVKPEEYAPARVETLLGVLLSDAFAFFIIVATGATLFFGGVHEIASADQAAQALAPIAGPFAEELFGLGLLGASLLAASILPLSTAYAICEAFGWERGVNHTPDEARIFYGLYTALIVVGAAVALIPNVPFFVLSIVVYALNGILLPILLVLMLRLANNSTLMGSATNSRTTNLLGWATTIVILVLSAILLIVSLFPVHL
jgi:NRAMP (natural resistance-associated macrophage protein)-like metal ion transporter